MNMFYRATWTSIEAQASVGARDRSAKGDRKPVPSCPFGNKSTGCYMPCWEEEGRPPRPNKECAQRTHTRAGRVDRARGQ